MKLYKYVGPSGIRARADFDTPRHLVVDARGILAWATEMAGLTSKDRELTFTYVVLPVARLFLADRRSEHVACARGSAVVTAGEITFERHGSGLILAEISNLSTGYCPEPGSWPVINEALVRAGFPSIRGFTHPFEFRFCAPCAQTCVIKDHAFICPACSGDLPREWNYHPL